MALQQLDDACAAGNYYESLQFYKTKIARKMNSKKGPSEALALISDGVRVCSKHGENGIAAAIDISKQIFTLFESFKMGHQDESLEMLCAVSDCFVPLENPVVATGSLELMQEAMRWAHDRRTPQGKVSAKQSDEFYNRLGQRSTMLVPADYARSYRFLINSRTSSDSLAVATTKLTESASASDRDLFCLRAFLQLMCRTRAFEGETKEEARTAAITNAEAFLTATSASRTTKVATQLPAALIVLSKKSVAFDSSSTAAAMSPSPHDALCEAGDAVVEAYSPYFDATDAKLKDLLIAVVQAHRITKEHTKKSSSGGLLGMLSMMGGGSS